MLSCDVQVHFDGRSQDFMVFLLTRFHAGVNLTALTLGRSVLRWSDTSHLYTARSIRRYISFVALPLRFRPNLVNAAKTAMSSKILGPESSFFAEMAVDAVTAVRMESGGDMGKKASPELVFNAVLRRRLRAEESQPTKLCILPQDITVYRCYHGCGGVHYSRCCCWHRSIAVTAVCLFQL